MDFSSFQNVKKGKVVLLSPSTTSVKVTPKPAPRGFIAHYSAQSGSLLRQISSEVSQTHSGEYHFDYGNQVRIRSVDPSKNVITGLPFEATYCPDLLDGDSFYIATSLTAMDIAHFQLDSFSTPRYLKNGKFSILTFKDENYPQLDFGFVATANGLVFKDKHGLCFPITHQLIMLLVAISPYFPKEMKRIAFQQCYGDIESVPIRYGDKKPRQIARMIYREYFDRKRVTELHGRGQPYSKVLKHKSDSKPYEPHSATVRERDLTRNNANEVEESTASDFLMAVGTVVSAIWAFAFIVRSNMYEPHSGLATPLTGTMEEAAAFTGTNEQDGGLKSKSTTKFGGTARADEPTVDYNVIGSYMDERGREVMVRNENNTVTMSAVQTVKKPLHFGGGL